MLCRAGLLVLGIAATLGLAAAQDAGKELAAQQKGAAAANLKKAEFTRTAIVESERFILATTLNEEKARSLVAVLERMAPVARKSLQFEPKDEAWKGRLAIYFLPDGRDYRSFMRTVVVAQPGGVHSDLRNENPYIVDPGEVPAKATEADQFAACSAVVAGTLMRGKGGTAELPDWLVNGFGRVTAMRAEGLSSARYQKHRTAARTLARRGDKPSDLWAENRSPSADILANSFAEYLAYGPGAPNLIKLVNGFRPDENGNVPAVAAAFEAAGWKDMAMLEAAWRKWVQTGK